MSSLHMKYGRPLTISKLVLIMQVCLSLNAAAQQENVWTFGFQAGLDFNGPGDPVAIQSGLHLDYFSPEMTASVCDESGNLLFYTDGTFVYDRQHNLMPDGVDLTGIPNLMSNGNLRTPTFSTRMGPLIVPVPDDPGRYYIFSLVSQERDFVPHTGDLYYSVVDMSLNGGLGDIVPGSKGIFLDGGLSESLAGVAGDACNIWVLSCASDRNELRAYEVTAQGVAAPVRSQLVYYDHFIAVSNDRKLLVIAGQLYDFSPLTGRVSNPREVDPAGIAKPCFSPDDNMLYGMAFLTGSLYQYDVSSRDAQQMSNSRILIAGGLPVEAVLKAGPDGRIYYIDTSRASMGRIEYPDLRGAACQPRNRVIPLLPGTSGTRFGLTNNVPVFRRHAASSYREISVCMARHRTINLAPGNLEGHSYVWNDGEARKERLVDSSGLYTVEYYTAPCTLHSDSFRVVFMYPSYSSMTEVICGNEHYDFGGRLLDLPGRYRDTLTASNGCDSIVTLDLILLPPEDISITLPQSGGLPCIGDLIEVTASGAHQFSWIVNGSITGQEGNVALIRVPASSGEIQAAALFDNGCRDTVAVSLQAQICCRLQMPDAFTPNGDGRNDRLRPINASYITAYDMRVLNRWGQTVFTGDQTADGWDGTIHGVPADLGTYFYHLSFECPEMIRREHASGGVTLIR